GRPSPNVAAANQRPHTWREDASSLSRRASRTFSQTGWVWLSVLSRAWQSSGPPRVFQRACAGLIRLMATTAPAAAIADPTAVAVKNPRTRRTSSGLNLLPNHRSSSQAVTRLCSVLRKPKAIESPAFRPIERPHAVDAKQRPLAGEP